MKPSSECRRLPSPPPANTIDDQGRAFIAELLQHHYHDRPDVREQDEGEGL